MRIESANIISHAYRKKLTPQTDLMDMLMKAVLAGHRHEEEQVKLDMELKRGINMQKAQSSKNSRML